MPEHNTFTQPACRVCGCTWTRACPGGCYWSEPGLCSACVGCEVEEDESPVPVESTYHLYRVQLASTSGHYAQYDGHVDVWSPTDDRGELFTRAVRELGCSSFPDRKSTLFWRFKGAEKLR